MSPQENPVLVMLDVLLDEHHPAELDGQRIPLAAALCEAPVPYEESRGA